MVHPLRNKQITWLGAIVVLAVLFFTAGSTVAQSQAQPAEQPSEQPAGEPARQPTTRSSTPLIPGGLPDPLAPPVATEQPVDEQGEDVQPGQPGGPMEVRSDTLPSPTLPAPGDLPNDVDVDILRLAIKPLGRDEVQTQADRFLSLMQAKQREISALRIAGRQAKSESGRNRYLEQALPLENEREALGDRLEVVLNDLENKGGDVADYRAMFNTLSSRDSDPADVGEWYTRAQNWLWSVDGGLLLLFNIVRFVVIIALAWLLAKVMARITAKALKRVRGASSLLRLFIAGLVRKIILVIGVVVALSFLGVNIAPLVAAIGAAGLVVGLALQGTLSNFASGILILLYRPYDVGDVITAGGVSGGKVEAMSLVSTTILTFDNQRIIVPNNSIWNDNITNLTGMPTRRIDMTFGVSYDDNLDHVMEVLLGLCNDHPLVLDNPPPLIKVTSHGDSSISVVCRPWGRTEDYWTIYWDFQKLVKQRFDAEGISIPFPQRDLHIFQARKEPPEEPASDET